ncbi:hypothetical protein G3O08_06865 [Cryomorpha ignava]|uniref:Uncharacterized protein n=1 Tax=Cryomorpha ignava TaxID=101383 RepID=A0A7K3WNI9_9FLAO|nr:hypothetical protein [Cryomorpha ignava]NEN23219.1 hypothetical protein [Cryomorpha ignava]
MTLKYIFGILIIGFLVASCTDDTTEDISANPGYTYFPIEIGTYVVYKADSIYHDQPLANVQGIHDTAHFFVKELIDSVFTDASEEESQRVLRYKRNTDADPWVLSDAWYAKRTASNAQRVEENRRYVKLGFPISPFSNWNGNALNDLDEWRYEYDSLYMARTVGDLAFPKTITVTERNFLTEVNDEFAYEIYAEDVGLIFRHHKVLFTRPSYLNNRVAQNIISGYEYKWEIVDYGME